jgi:hypothetical protein
VRLALGAELAGEETELSDADVSAQLGIAFEP